MSTPAEQDPLGIDAAQFLSTIRSMMEEYITDCFCAVDEAMIRPPHNLSCEEQSLLLKGSTSLYDMAMRRVRDETQRFELEALQGSLGRPAGLDFSENRPLPWTQDSQGAQEESKLDTEMAEMRTRLAVIQREVRLLTAPAAKLRACLEANSNAERSHDAAPGTLLGKENMMEDAAAVHSALQNLRPLLETCQQLQQSARTNDHVVKPRSIVSAGASGVTPMQGNQFAQLYDIRSAVPSIVALLDQEG